MNSSAPSRQNAFDRPFRLTSEDVRRLTFPVKFRGFSPVAVLAQLTVIAEEMGVLETDLDWHHRNRDERELELAEFRERDRDVQEALIIAQERAAEIVARAEAKAREIIAEAEAECLRKMDAADRRLAAVSDEARLEEAAGRRAAIRIARFFDTTVVHAQAAVYAWESGDLVAAARARAALEASMAARLASDAESAAADGDASELTRTLALVRADAADLLTAAGLGAVPATPAEPVADESPYADPAETALPLAEDAQLTPGLRALATPDHWPVGRAKMPQLLLGTWN